MKHIKYHLNTRMDIFDWFDAAEFDYLNHIMLSKLDGDERVRRALPEIRKRAQWLVRIQRGCENAYPEYTAA